MSNNPNHENTSLQHSIISTQLVDATFGYQKEIMELKHKKAMNLKKKHPIEIENENLKLKQQKNMERIQELDHKLREARAKQCADKVKLTELYNLTTLLIRCPSPSVMLRCRDAITAAENSL